MVGDVSEESLGLKTLGTVMNFEPSLFVYFAVGWEVGDAGDWAVCFRWFAGIPIRGRLDVGAWRDSQCSLRRDQILPEEGGSQPGGQALKGERLPGTHGRCE
jgi:hypothetical protein